MNDSDSKQDLNTDFLRNTNKKKFYQYWRFWFFLFVIIVSLIWVIVSIFLAYLNSRRVTDINQNNNNNQLLIDKIYSLTDPSLGNPNASLQVVEFSDFQCPYCAQAHTIIRDLLNNYPFDVYFIYRDFPIDEIHHQARLAAEAAQCAFDQNKFWEYHDLLFQNQDKLDLGYLLLYAQRLNIDMEKFSECLKKGKYSNEVQQDLTDGYDVGVKATPTFFINGQKIEGVIPYDNWLELINLSKS